ncbi:MAG: hypothetical protein ACE5HO_18120, partial [bacterium]
MTKPFEFFDKVEPQAAAPVLDNALPYTLLKNALPDGPEPPVCAEKAPAELAQHSKLPPAQAC